MRLLLPHVIALEVWDLPVAGKLLQEWRTDAAFPHHLAAAVHALRTAALPTFNAATRIALAAIRHLHLTGGAADASLATTLQAVTGLATTWSNDPFAAARAGATLDPGALCADVGQTSIKLVREGARDLPEQAAPSVSRDSVRRTARIARDLVLAPMRDDTPVAARETMRASTIQFLGGLLAEPRVDRIVLALPCELDDTGIPRSCSYCFRDPDPELVPALEQLAQAPISVVNDAELAALAAAHDPAVPHSRTTLVLTLGFGIGAALLLPRPA